MLYENIVSDSVYVSKEILFEISPTEEDEIALSVGYGTTHWMRSPRFSPAARTAGVTVRDADLLSTHLPTVSTTYKTQVKGTMEESVCKNKSLVHRGHVREGSRFCSLLVSKALLMVRGLSVLRSSAPC